MRMKGGNSLGIVVLVAATLLVSGSQCARVGDQALAPSLTSAQKDQQLKDCFKNCAQTAREARQAEQQRFQQAKKDCGSDQQCRQEQAALHEANMEQIDMMLEQCVAGCHEQGSGGGGE